MWVETERNCVFVFVLCYLDLQPANLTQPNVLHPILTLHNSPSVPLGHLEQQFFSCYCC